jgi:hypothetical protein
MVPVTGAGMYQHPKPRKKLPDCYYNTPFYDILLAVRKVRRGSLLRQLSARNNPRTNEKIFTGVLLTFKMLVQTGPQ